MRQNIRTTKSYLIHWITNNFYLTINYSLVDRDSQLRELLSSQLRSEIQSGYLAEANVSPQQHFALVGDMDRGSVSVYSSADVSGKDFAL